jgi:chromosome segregation ATPase
MKVAWKIQAVILMLCVMPVGCKHTLTPAQKNLSDICATSSLLALKAIQRDLYVPEVGSHTVSRATQEKIDAVDVAAVAPEERAIASELNTIYDGQLFLNSRADLLRHEDKLASFGSETVGLKTEREETSKQVDTFRMALDKCFTDFDASLRARSLFVPESCAAVPGMKQQMVAEWQQLETDLAAQNKEQEKQTTAQARLQQRQHSLEVCDAIDKDLKDHPNNITDSAYQKERLKSCEDVRSGKLNDLKSAVR